MIIQKDIQNESVPGNKCLVLLVHDTGSTPNTLWGNIKKFLTRKDYISIHYLIGKTQQDGVIQYEEEDRIAYHAGVSAWGILKDLNKCSIGIEVFCTDGTFTQWQRDTLRELCQNIMRRHNIPSSMVLCHKDVALPKGRRSDPRPDLYAPWGSWEAFQRSLDNNDTQELENAFKRDSEALHPYIVNLNATKLKLAEAKGVEFKPYFLTDVK